MWQTILNALTFNQNFAAGLRAGGGRGERSGSRVKFAVDAVVTALAALPVLVASAPLEYAAAWRVRGVELRAIARPLE
jgi:hypothetical protein